MPFTCLNIERGVCTSCFVVFFLCVVVTSLFCSFISFHRHTLMPLLRGKGSIPIH